MARHVVVIHDQAKILCTCNPKLKFEPKGKWTNPSRLDNAIKSHLGQTSRGKVKGCILLESRLAKKERDIPDWTPEKEQMKNFLEEIEKKRSDVKKKAHTKKEKKKKQEVLNKTISIPLDKLDVQLKSKKEKLPFLFGFHCIIFQVLL